jgi:hypothetical protein
MSAPENAPQNAPGDARDSPDAPDAPGPAAEPICSAKDCRRPATWALRWNNPKIHTSDRRKTWLACDEHRDHLGGFLSARGFLRETEPCTAGGEEQT